MCARDGLLVVRYSCCSQCKDQALSSLRSFSVRAIWLGTFVALAQTGAVAHGEDLEPTSCPIRMKADHLEIDLVSIDPSSSNEDEESLERELENAVWAVARSEAEDNEAVRRLRKAVCPTIDWLRSVEPPARALGKICLAAAGGCIADVGIGYCLAKLNLAERFVNALCPPPKQAS